MVNSSYVDSQQASARTLSKAVQADQDEVAQAEEGDPGGQEVSGEPDVGPVAADADDHRGGRAEVEHGPHRLLQAGQGEVDRRQCEQHKHHATVPGNSFMPGAGFVPGHLADPPGLGHFGLASMRQQVEMAGGVWQVRPQPGRGTTVTATLPIAGAGRAAEPPRRPGPVAQPTGGRDGG